MQTYYRKTTESADYIHLSDPLSDSHNTEGGSELSIKPIWMRIKGPMRYIKKELIPLEVFLTKRNVHVVTFCIFYSFIY